MGALTWPADGPLAEQRPATDVVLLELRDCVRQVREHLHPSHEDFFCRNLTAYMGERMGAVLRRVADTEAEVRRLNDRCTALADHALELLDGTEPDGAA